MIFIKLSVTIIASALAMYLFFQWIEKYYMNNLVNAGLDRIIRFTTVILSFTAFYFWGMLNQIIISQKLPSFITGALSGLISSFLFLLIQWIMKRKSKIHPGFEFYVAHAVIVFPLGGALASVTGQNWIQRFSESRILFILVAVIFFHFILSDLIFLIGNKKRKSAQTDTECNDVDMILKKSTAAGEETQIIEEKGNIFVSVIHNNLDYTSQKKPEEIIIAETVPDFSRDELYAYQNEFRLLLKSRQNEKSGKNA